MELLNNGSIQIVLLIIAFVLTAGFPIWKKLVKKTETKLDDVLLLKAVKWAKNFKKK